MKFHLSLGGKTACGRKITRGTIAVPPADFAERISVNRCRQCEAAKLHPFVGTRRVFTYPDFGTPDGHPDYTAHSGQTVTVTRQLTNTECDPECQPMLAIVADDGWQGHAHAAELDGTARPLRRQDHKLALPAGTADRYLTPAEIDAAIATRHLPDSRLAR